MEEQVMDQKGKRYSKIKLVDSMMATLIFHRGGEKGTRLKEEVLVHFRMDRENYDQAIIDWIWW